MTTGVLYAAGTTKDGIHRLAQAGVLIRKGRGVYLLGHDAPDERRAWRAALLRCGADAALTGHTMAKLLGVSRRRSVPIQVVVPRPRRPRPGIQLTVSSRLRPTDLIQHAGLVGTSIEWTLLAMAPTSTPGELTRAMREYVFHHGELDLDRIEAHIRRMRPAPGASVLRQAISDARDGHGGTDSRFEDQLRLALHGLRTTDPLTNVPFHAISGRQYRLDNYYVADRLCVEADSGFHETDIRRAADAFRDRDLAASDVHTIRIREDDFRRDPVAALLPVRTYVYEPAGAAMEQSREIAVNEIRVQRELR